MRLHLGLLFLALVTLAACNGGSPTGAPASPAPERTPTLLPEEQPPAQAEAEFDTDFSQHTVPYAEILSGGITRDTIPAIDAPEFVDVDAADAWLQPDEAIVVVQQGGEARAYPIRILMWHEIVNDTVGETPVAVTYCPLCNTAIAFDRRLDGRVLDFGTTGRLRYSNLVMYDRQTESWWQQGIGEAIVGELVGQQLTFVPAAVVGWQDFKAAYPGGQVLSRETGHARDYGRNPYVGYDDPDRFPRLYEGPEVPDDLLPVARVLGIAHGPTAIAYPFEHLKERYVVNDTLGEAPIVVMWQPGVASPLDAGEVAAGRDIGAANAFSRELDGETLTFRADGTAIVDEESGSTWNLLGEAVSGPRAGERLEPVVAHDFFWFAWAAFHPGTEVYTP